MGGIPEHLKFHGKEGALKIQKREGSTAHVKSQRKQEMGLDPEHSEKTRLWSVLRKRHGGHYRQKEQHEAGKGKKKASGIFKN